MEIKSFKISGHSTRQKWAVYLFVATPNNGLSLKKIYVGKVGDNRDGCNPVISRVGNHFSFNKVHSQIRTLIGNTENYDYEYFYRHFDDYESEKSKRDIDRDKINEMERELNRIVQRNMDNGKYELINPYHGKYVTKSEKTRRASLLTINEKKSLSELCEKALS